MAVNGVEVTFDEIVTVTVWLVVGCALSTVAEHDPDLAAVVAVVARVVVVVVVAAASAFFIVVGGDGAAVVTTAAVTGGEVVVVVDEVVVVLSVVVVDMLVLVVDGAAVSTVVGSGCGVNDAATTRPAKPARAYPTTFVPPRRDAAHAAVAIGRRTTHHATRAIGRHCACARCADASARSNRLTTPRTMCPLPPVATEMATAIRRQ